MLCPCAVCTYDYLLVYFILTIALLEVVCILQPLTDHRAIISYHILLKSNRLRGKDALWQHGLMDKYLG